MAWTVNEIDRSWPTRVDAVAIDGETLQVVDRTRFSDFPLMAKLTRWGVDFSYGNTVRVGEPVAVGGIRVGPVRHDRRRLSPVVDPPSGAECV